LKASLVYDGGPKVIIPESMGTPCPDQLQGTVHEQLGELACRICYDSMGYDSNGVRRGRSSAQLHKHILEVQNLSVYGHPNFTVHFNDDIRNACINRKGIWVEGRNEITTNLWAVLEWNKYTCLANQDISYHIGNSLAFFANQLAPQIYKRKSGVLVGTHLKTENLTENQAWVTLYLYGSRGFTHEQVRHHFGGISQRSTRYVDESESSWIEHPLITQYLTDETVPVEIRQAINDGLLRLINYSKTNYNALASHLKSYLIGRGVDKTKARKQAWGAARGYLGNALASDMLFSAPVSGWKWMLKQRLSAAADAEIRAIYEQVLISLRRSRYGYMFFDEFTLVPSPDGIGKVLK
jgi:hypothetical protein